ncbi:MAG: hypothetical protein Q9191_004668 [Dirinaria sp. TL-2023a]
MPIKLPKAFPRRKSSGHVLEEVENPPEPSFRVFERPSHKSFDGGNSLKRMSQARPLSAGYRSEEHIQKRSQKAVLLTYLRGSGGTNNSASSGHDNSSASARYSSSSTLPSSTDIALDDGPSPHPKTSDNIPIPPTPSSNPLSFRAGARTFSFGRKKAQTSSQHVSDSPAYTNATRERALTESSYASGSTATPPKILDTGLDFGMSDLDGFGTMFDNVGKRRSQQDENVSPGGSRMSVKPYSDRPANTPSPIHIDRSSKIVSSPYSQNSDNSQDGLMSSASPAIPAAKYYEDSPPVPRHNRPLHSQTLPVNTSSSSRSHQPGSQPVTTLQRTGGRPLKRDSLPLQDEDERLVMESIRASQRLNRRSRDFDSYIDSYRDSYGEDEEGFERQPTISPVRSPALPGLPNYSERQKTPVELHDGPHRDASNTRWTQGSAETTPRAKKLDLAQPEEERSLFDKSPPRPSRSVPPPRKPIPPANTGSNKVMTPAEFERYRREQESMRRASDNTKSDDSSEDSDHYDDEDEEERKKELAKERRKQEAHLAVYRQQMMKVTGQQPSELPNLRPELTKSQTAPAARALTPTFSFDKPPETSKASDDEDDEVPLGILAAHGFPTKNRPPSASTGTSIKYQSETYPPPPMSSAGGSTAGGRPGLPPFAKNLPPDPYFGAGLVNPSARESLGFNRHSPGSAYGGSQATAHPTHPAGLVGVIAGEERARAARRGSPNAQGGFGSPMPQGMMPPTMGMPPMLSPGDEAQIHMSQQMTQMMQMQMQWMQSMQSMMAQGMQPPMGPMPGQPPMPPQHMQMAQTNNGFLSPQPQQQHHHQHHQQMAMQGMPPPAQIPRPVSHSAPSSPAAVQQGPRAMSMMTPGGHPQWQTMPMNGRPTAPSMIVPGQSGYTPSIAPSERSNVGMPSRYRPISVPAIDETSRPGSSMSMSTAGKLNHKAGAAGVGGGIRQVKKTASDDDDDEQGWEEMKKRRDAKKSSWKSQGNRRDENQVSLEGIYFPDEQ